MIPEQRLVENLTLDRRGRRRRSMRRMWSIDGLLSVRAWFAGPKWKRHCEVTERPIAEVNPAAAKYHRPGRKLLVFSLENEVRELACEQLRPGTFAQWSDPYEWLGLSARAGATRRATATAPTRTGRAAPGRPAGSGSGWPPVESRPARAQAAESPYRRRRA